MKMASLYLDLFSIEWNDQDMDLKTKLVLKLKYLIIDGKITQKNVDIVQI